MKRVGLSAAAQRRAARSALNIVRVLARLAETVGLPAMIVVDNGPEFVSRTVDAWTYARGVTQRYIRPGKPVENAYIESFDGTFRDECLSEHWFATVAKAQAVIEDWPRLQPGPSAQRARQRPADHR